MPYNYTQSVGLMVKYPQLGMVKTRLAADVGEAEALAVYRKLIENSCQQCPPAAEDNYRLGCFVTPGSRLDDFRREYYRLAFYAAQNGNNLGQRMLGAFDRMFKSRNTERCLLIGADIPCLSRKQIRIAFRELDRHDVVWGPTSDGGYYLVGLKKPTPSIFDDSIKWGTKEVLAQSLAIAKEQKLSYRLLETLHDLDDARDLTRFADLMDR